MLAERTDRFLASVNRPTICVAHGGVIRTLFKRIGKVPDEDAAMVDIPQDRVLKIDGDRSAGCDPFRTEITRPARDR
jgi:broad specificity phosphatase PhoE